MFLMQHFNPFMCLQHEAHKKNPQKKARKDIPTRNAILFLQKKRVVVDLFRDNS